MAKEYEVIAEWLYQHNKSDRQIAFVCGVTPTTIRSWRRKKKYKTRVERTENPNPCAICQRNIMQCPWLHKGIPVPGWDAELVKKKVRASGSEDEYTTWAIKKCPLYIAPAKERMRGCINEL